MGNANNQDDEFVSVDATQDPVGARSNSDDFFTLAFKNFVSLGIGIQSECFDVLRYLPLDLLGELGESFLSRFKESDSMGSHLQIQALLHIFPFNDLILGIGECCFSSGDVCRVLVGLKLFKIFYGNNSSNGLSVPS